MTDNAPLTPPTPAEPQPDATQGQAAAVEPATLQPDAAQAQAAAPEPATPQPAQPRPAGPAAAPASAPQTAVPASAPRPPAPEPTPAPAPTPAPTPTWSQATQPSPTAEPVAPAAPRAGSTTRGRARSIMTGLAFFLACLSLILATTTWWLHDTLLDTDHFVALTAPLASDPEVQEALVQVTVNQVDEALELGPVGQYVVAGIAREVYTSDAFAQLWERLMSAVHPRLVAVLRGESSVVQTSEGQVIVNLFPLIDRLFARINALNIEIAGQSITAPTLTDPDDPEASRAELSAALGRPLPETFGVIPVADSARLEAAQRYVTLFDALVVVLLVVTALLAILTVALARHRVRMVALLGLGFLAALLAARLVVSSAADGLATMIAEAGPGAILGGEIVKTIADSYREFARGVLLISLVAAVIATAAAWYEDRRVRAEEAARGVADIADGWFLALAGLSLALAALLVVGLSAPTLVVVVAAYVVWLAVLVRWRRQATRAAAAEGSAG